MAPSQMSALTAKVMRSLRQSKRAFDMAANQGKRSLSSSSSSSSSSYSMVQQQQREEQQPDTNARCPFLAVHGLQEGASHGCPYLLSMKAKEKEEETVRYRSLLPY